MRFAIIGAGRTGSSHLVRLLNTHPEILCHGEVFHGRKVQVNTHFLETAGERAALHDELLECRTRDRLEFLDHIFTVGGGRPIVGFKIFSTHTAAALAAIMADRGIKKVVLYRTNALACYASLKAAHESGNWGWGQGKPLVPFDAPDFLSWQGRYSGFIEQTLRTLIADGQPYHVVRYDEVNNHLLMTALVRFLGATQPLPDLKPPAEGRAPADILSRFSNPAEAESFLRANRLMHWAFEGDTIFGIESNAPPTEAEET